MKTIVVGIVVILSVVSVMLMINQQKVEVLYFTNSNCLVASEADKALQEMTGEFNEKITIRQIQINMYSDDPPDSEEIKELREKYNVNGVPTLIINGKEFTGRYTKENLIREVCKNFLLKPEGC